MKYVISWIQKPTVGEAEAARSLQVFGKWTPSENATFEQFLGRVDAKGGYAVVTTDDVNAIVRDMAIFGTWFDMEVVPVVEVGDLATIAGEALEFMGSIS
ncbi:MULTISPECIES: DUF3303 domain-containing protein [unclassified Nocardioides]|uniref:DUF3303 domain-containing protein n=1 Tax=unclassified Nocardioides TaxID=2615069 RepID=UPI00360B7279